ncbi:MAG: hypothetical protein Ct9H90mP2_06530 [Dehalococcoidia bacterium]|nr:MAG: hypothetical protein Ct9H90mP2_06530 [Dehalococcoidia bacterium]
MRRKLFAYEVAYLQSQGEVPSIEGSVAKILGTQLAQKIAKMELISQGYMDNSLTLMLHLMENTPINN